MKSPLNTHIYTHIQIQTRTYRRGINSSWLCPSHHFSAPYDAKRRREIKLSRRSQLLQKSEELTRDELGSDNMPAQT